MFIVMFKLVSFFVKPTKTYCYSFIPTKFKNGDYSQVFFKRQYYPFLFKLFKFSIESSVNVKTYNELISCIIAYNMLNLDIKSLSKDDMKFLYSRYVEDLYPDSLGKV